MKATLSIKVPSRQHYSECHNTAAISQINGLAILPTKSPSIMPVLLWLESYGVNIASGMCGAINLREIDYTLN